MKMWITIVFKDGEICRYSRDEYTDYQYDNKCFIVIHDRQWIGIYNLDEIRYIEVSTKEEAERSNREYTFYERKEK